MTTVGAVAAVVLGALLIAIHFSCRPCRSKRATGSGASDHATGGIIPVARRVSSATMRALRPSPADREARSSLVGISLPSDGHLHDLDESVLAPPLPHALPLQRQIKMSVLRMLGFAVRFNTYVHICMT